MFQLHVSKPLRHMEYMGKYIFKNWYAKWSSTPYLFFFIINWLLLRDATTTYTI